jgi:hypothetical protein
VDVMVFVIKVKNYKVSSKFVKSASEKVYSIGFPSSEVLNGNLSFKSISEKIGAKSFEEWNAMQEFISGKPTWCYFDFDEKNGEKNGKLYNWFAVSDTRGLAPKGYHMPSDAEWTILTDKLGGEEIAVEKMKSKTGWKGISNGGKKACIDCSDWTQSYRDQVPCHTCKNARTVKTPEVIKTGGDNSSGFIGLPGGSCNYSGYFYSITKDGYWWSSSENSEGSAWYRNLNYLYTKVNRNDYYLNFGFSVRCLRD